MQQRMRICITLHFVNKYDYIQRNQSNVGYSHAHQQL